MIFLQSHIDEQSDREEDMRDCESSDEGVNVNVNGISGSMDFTGSRSPDRNTDLKYASTNFIRVAKLIKFISSSETSFPSNHPLGMLSALNMGVPNLHSFQQQHNDVLEKIKMQVRDMKVGFMNSDFSALHPSFTSTLQSTLGFNTQTSAQNNHQNSSSLQLSNNSNNNESLNGHFPFSSPTAAANKDGK